ncbi:exopolysaccharide biosynthesis protein [Mesorhizobium sp. CAU 1732]|uniref:exopolysaccharide biosynthesis protein n=1 Tax=Mesorhizobium sp. CAU 1732 TaxID=3140358 RepID=UPI003260D4F4
MATRTDMEALDQNVGGPDGEPVRGTALVARQPRRLSQVLREMCLPADGPVTIGGIREAIGDRGFAALLFLFAALNLLPLPPGSTLLFGIPLMIVSGQMMLGYNTPWLPRRLLERPIDRETFRNGCNRLLPKLEWLERLVHPRYWPFATARADRLIGAAALLLSIVVFLPIPLGNWLPAFSVAILGLAVSERDGVFLGAGLALGILSLVVIGVVVGTAGYVAGSMFGFHF